MFLIQLKSQSSLNVFFLTKSWPWFQNRRSENGLTQLSVDLLQNWSDDIPQNRHIFRPTYIHFFIAKDSLNMKYFPIQLWTALSRTYMMLLELLRRAIRFLNVTFSFFNLNQTAVKAFMLRCYIIGQNTFVKATLATHSWLWREPSWLWRDRPMGLIFVNEEEKHTIETKQMSLLFTGPLNFKALKWCLPMR